MLLAYTYKSALQSPLEEREESEPTNFSCSFYLLSLYLQDFTNIVDVWDLNSDLNH